MADATMTYNCTQEQMIELQRLAKVYGSKTGAVRVGVKLLTLVQDKEVWVKGKDGKLERVHFL